MRMRKFQPVSTISAFPDVMLYFLEVSYLASQTGTCFTPNTHPNLNVSSHVLKSARKTKRPSKKRLFLRLFLLKRDKHTPKNSEIVAYFSFGVSPLAWWFHIESIQELIFLISSSQLTSWTACFQRILDRTIEPSRLHGTSSCGFVHQKWVWWLALWRTAKCFRKLLVLLFL